MSPANLVDLRRGLADVGIQHIIFNVPNNCEIAHIETIGREIIPAVTEF